VTTDQLVMLGEDNVTEPMRFYTDFGIAPESLVAGLRRMFPSA
jgi:hypothetical protein